MTAARLHELVDTALLYNVEVEQALLGAILNNPVTIDRIELTAADFGEPLHAMTFAHMSEAARDGRLLDRTLLRAELAKAGQQEIVRGQTLNQYLARLYAEAPPVMMAPGYARTVRAFAQKRAIVAAVTDALAAIEAGDDPTAVAAGVVDAMDDIMAGGANEGTAPLMIGEAAEKAAVAMTEAIQRGGPIRGLGTGIRDLDDKLGGLQRGNFVILGGRPGMGKSGIATTIARNAAEAGHGVMMFSLEMTAQEIGVRAISDAVYNRDSPTYQDIERGRLPEVWAQRVIDAQRAMRQLPLRIEQEGGLSLAQIASRARRHKQQRERQGKTLDLLIVDHLQLVRPSNRYSGNRVSETTEVSGSFKALAKALNVPILALAQLNRGVEEREDKRPRLSDLRESGAIEQDADVVMFVFREEYYLANTACSDRDKEAARQARLYEVANRTEINIAKQRQGPTGTVEVFFDASRNAVRDLSRAA